MCKRCDVALIVLCMLSQERYNYRFLVQLCLSIGGHWARQAQCKWNQWHEPKGCETVALGWVPESLITIVCGEIRSVV